MHQSLEKTKLQELPEPTQRGLVGGGAVIGVERLNLDFRQHVECHTYHNQAGVSFYHSAKTGQAMRQ
jgi:hypothetical protein